MAAGGTRNRLKPELRGFGVPALARGAVARFRALKFLAVILLASPEGGTPNLDPLHLWFLILHSMCLTNFMSALEPPDTHYLSAAIGWLELGNPAEAKTELARMTQPSRRNPGVLEVEWAIHAGQNDWSAGLLAAQTLM